MGGKRDGEPGGMKRPSFQFYPGDWSSNPNLKRCTFAERGIWLEVMCLMHDQEPYGVLRWPLKEIAQAVGCKPADLLALARKGVLKGSDEALTEAFVYTPRSGRKDGEPVTLVPTQAGPIWYSSRMVKDEYVRTIRGENGGNGESPKPGTKAAPKPPIGETFGPRDARTPAAPSSSSSSSPSGEEQEKARKRAAPVARPPDVSEQVWADWVQHRKAKRATVTATVVEEARAEASKAGMTLEAFLRVWCRRGSQGLEAAWLRPDERQADGHSLFAGAE